MCFYIFQGSLTDADELRCASPEAFDQDKCRSVCCGVEQQNSNYNVYLNDVYMVVPEPEEIKIIPTTSTTMRSTTGNIKVLFIRWTKVSITDAFAFI